MGILVTPFGGPKSESDNVIKLGDSAQFSQAVYNKSYAIGYRYWKIQVLQCRSDFADAEMMNVYFLQNSVTQSVIGVTATGGTPMNPAANLLIEDTSLWKDSNPTLGSPPEIIFDFGREMTFDEIRWRTTSGSINSDPISLSILGSNNELTYSSHGLKYYESLTESRGELVTGLYLDQSVFFNCYTPSGNNYVLLEGKEERGPANNIITSSLNLISWVQTNLNSNVTSLADAYYAITYAQDLYFKSTAVFNHIHENTCVRSCVLYVDANNIMSYHGHVIGQSGGLFENKKWVNLRNTQDENFFPLKLTFESDSLLGHPATASAPNGLIAIDFKGGTQRATWVNPHIEGSPVTFSEITAEIWCKFENTFPDGWVWGFRTFGVMCQDGYLGFTTTNSNGSGGYDLYGVRADSFTGTYVHIVTQLLSQDDSYELGKIWINGELQTLTQVTGTEESGNRVYNGPGAIGGVDVPTSPVPNLDFNVALFRFYNTLLSEDEISINYQAFQTRFDL